MEILVLLETSRSIGLAMLCAVFALSTGLLAFDRTPRTDDRIEDMARPQQRRAA